MGFFDDLLGTVTNAVKGTFGAMGSIGESLPLVGNTIKGANEAAFNGIERLGQGAYWLYSNAVSRPLSTMQLAADEAGISTGFGGIDPIATLRRFKANGVEGAIGFHGVDKATKIFDGETWSKSYKRAQYISPGQASVAIGQMQQSNSFKLNLDDPVAVKQYFSSGGQKWTSGAIDFGVSWYADPLVAGLKAAKFASTATHVKPGVETALGQVTKTHTSSIDDALNSSTVNRFVDWTEGKNAYQLMQLDSIKKSANGPLLATLLERAGDSATKRDILRVSFGDVRAMDDLKIRQADLAESIEYANARYTAIGNQLSTLTPGSTAHDLAENLRKTYQDSLNQAESKWGEITDRMGAYRSLDDLHAGKLTTEAADLRAKFKSAEKFSVSTGKPVHDLVHRNLYSRPLRIVRSFGDKHPNGWVDLNATDSIKEVEAWSQRVRGLSAPERQKWLSDYAAAGDKGSRSLNLLAMEQRAVTKMADAHGIERSDALQWYEEMHKAREGMRAKSSEVYSAARYEQESGQVVRVDDFGDDGSGIMLHPNLRTKMETSHQMMDLDLMERAIKVHGSSIGILRKGLYAGEDLSAAMGDAFNTAWKLGVLARLGYPIRAVSDGLLSQTARFGAMTMLGQLKNGAGRFAMNNMAYSEHALKSFAGEFKAAHIQDLKDDVAFLQRRVDDNPNMRQDLRQDAINQLESAKAQLADTVARSAKPERAKAGYAPFDLHGARFPGAFQGNEGDLYRKLSGADSSNAQLFKDYSDVQHGIHRSAGWRILSSAEDEPAHLAAWHDDIMNQIGQDKLGRMVLEGKSKEEVVAWFGTADGRAYRRSLDLKHVDAEDMFFRTRAEVDHYLPKAAPELRQLALEGRLTPEDLASAIPARVRPDVHSQQLMHNMGKGFLARSTDKAVEGFYHYLASMPENVLSRHPLYDRLYRGHVADMGGKLHGSDRQILASDVNAISKMARDKALRDLKRYAFDITHKGEAAHAMRFMFPFMAAAQEGWVRWARTVYDKPSTLGRVGQVFQSPEKLGMVVDQDGNQVDGYGYITKADGSRHFVEMSSRSIQLRVPAFMKGIPGLEDAGDFKIPKSSLNVVLQGDPWWNPGTGPLAQIPLNEVLKSKPELGGFFKKTGLMPFGAQGSIKDIVLPTAIKRYLDSDESSDDFQRQLWTVMQSETAKFQSGKRATAPTWAEVQKKAQTYFQFRTVTALALPFSLDVKDPYQFYRDEYRRMQDVDPVNAEAEFYNKYGADMFAFASSLGKNNAGVPATIEGVQAFQKYQDLIAEDPELGALIIGNEGNGPFSNDAYQYELNTPLGPGSKETLRRKLDAREVMQENQRRAGWAKFNDWMNYFRSEEFKKGVSNVEAATEIGKKAVTNMLGDPESPFYNEHWSTDYYSYDSKKYDRLIPKLQNLAEDERLINNPLRTDIRTLKTYLSAREAINQSLAGRSAKTLGAKSNSDLKAAWQQIVSQLLESDTRFESLHSRYLSRDLGIDIDTED